MNEPTHRVVVHSQAMLDLEKYYRFVWKQGGNQASAWYDRFIAHLKSLDRTPQRCPIARESKRVYFEVGEMHFGQHPNVFRILFTIDSDIVRILCIVRAQRRSPSWKTIQQSYFKE